MQVLSAGQKQINASRFGIDMGGISFSREGVTAHITAEGEFLNDKQAQQCDSCFEPFANADLIRIVDDRLSICRVCYLKHIRQ
jgi:formylmethanofuran dehydrogenase subunit E